MKFNGFNQDDFSVFKIDGLEKRMEAIQKQIQPKFKELGTELVEDLSTYLGNEVFLHIAKHARRTVNPPQDTWLAIADNKRGYKKHPHFQVGLFDDHMFFWLAFIYELDGKEKIADMFLNNYDKLKTLPTEFSVSLDHTKKDYIPIKDLTIEHLNRFKNVKKGEFLIGQHMTADDSRVHDGSELLNIIKNTFHILIPFYQKSLRVR